MNLRHFIYPNDKKLNSDDDNSSEEVDHPPSYFYSIQNPQYGPLTDDKGVERREIGRIPTFAIFHKLAVGKGVPHSFVCEFCVIYKFIEIN